MAKAFISGVGAVELQEKIVEITESGVYEVTPDSGKLLSKVTANVEVASSGGDKVYSKWLSYEIYLTGKEWSVWGGNGGFTGSKLVIPPVHHDSIYGELPVTNIKVGGFAENKNIVSVEADTINSTDGDSFSGCSNLRYLSIKGFTGFPSFAFYGLSSLSHVVFGKNLTQISWWCFKGCSPTAIFDFSECSSIPMLEETETFGTLTTGAKIIVPYSLIDEWKVATNWTEYADYIVAAD